MTLYKIIYLTGASQVLIGVALVFGLSAININTSIISFFGAAFIVSGLISLVKAWIFKFSTELGVTSKRVISKTGLISRKSHELSHSKVESFHVDQSIFGRLLGYGTIAVKGTGGGSAPIPNIDDPMEFRKRAMEATE